LLEEKLRLQRITKYGPGSEKLTSLQLELLELEPGVSNVEVAAEGEREALPATPDKQKRKRHPGRQTLPADLPRVERVIACTSEQCACGGCGQATTLIGYDESEQLDVEPAKYFVLVTKREKRACKSCEERGVMAAPLPDRILEKSLVSDRVIVDAITSPSSKPAADSTSPSATTSPRSCKASPIHPSRDFQNSHPPPGLLTRIIREG
jgi:hypothetical protein